SQLRPVTVTPQLENGLIAPAPPPAGYRVTMYPSTATPLASVVAPQLTCTIRPVEVVDTDGVAPWLTVVDFAAPLLPAVADAVRNAQAATPPPSATRTTRKMIGRRLC